MRCLSCILCSLMSIVCCCCVVVVVVVVVVCVCCVLMFVDVRCLPSVVDIASYSNYSM